MSMDALFFTDGHFSCSVSHGISAALPSVLTASGASTIAGYELLVR